MCTYDRPADTQENYVTCDEAAYYDAYAGLNMVRI